MWFGFDSGMITRIDGGVKIAPHPTKTAGRYKRKDGGVKPAPHPTKTEG
jgi:hypothetical protein